MAIVLPRERSRESAKRVNYKQIAGTGSHLFLPSVVIYRGGETREPRRRARGSSMMILVMMMMVLWLAGDERTNEGKKRNWSLLRERPISCAFSLCRSIERLARFFLSFARARRNVRWFRIPQRYHSGYRGGGRSTGPQGHRSTGPRVHRSTGPRSRQSRAPGAHRGTTKTSQDIEHLGDPAQQRAIRLVPSLSLPLSLSPPREWKTHLPSFLRARPRPPRPPRLQRLAKSNSTPSDLRRWRCRS